MIPMLRAVPGDDVHGLFDGVGVEILQLLLGDATEDVAGDGNADRSAYVTLPFRDAGSPAKQVRCRRGAGNEGERTVLVHRQVNGHDRASLAAGALVIILDEGHDVDAVLTQRRTNRRRWRGFASLQLKLDDGEYFSLPLTASGCPKFCAQFRARLSATQIRLFPPE